MLEGRDPGEYEFPTSQAIIEYATHRLLWSWYRRDGDSRIRPPEGQGSGEHDAQP
jgi:hypothetical protein